MKTKSCQLYLELESIARHSILCGGELEVGLASLRSNHLVALQGEVLVPMDASWWWPKRFKYHWVHCDDPRSFSNTCNAYLFAI